jgi:hypothetical protein
MSLELEYRGRYPEGADPGGAEGGPWVLSYTEIGQAGESGEAAASFVLPGGESAAGATYAVPLTGNSLGSLSFALSSAAYSGAAYSGAASSPALELVSLSLVPRWYGIERDGRGLRMSPFVFTGPEGAVGIDPPGEYGFPGGADLLIRSAGSVRWTIGDLRFERPFGGDLRVPGGFFPPTSLRVLVEGEGLESARLVPAAFRPFPSPISLDPALILAYPPGSWRRGDYEVFRWDAFPSLLIFDTADYTVQDRLFKRLAFFVEKAGYRGRLMEDEEIADQHGWNAHDYRAEDLARFFEAVRLADFPLLPEERELELILLEAGIIRREGDAVVPGEGGLVSISRESPAYLRSLFMAHEGFHGIFFIDREFRDFSRRRWEGLSATARRFILSYFDYQHYDTADEYLTINEFMAHVLQQPVSRAAGYFGETLASRIDASPWRRTVLPEKDEESGSWPVLAEDFLAEALAFNAYVAGRWGLAAGRVHRISVRDLAGP